MCTTAIILVYAINAYAIIFAGPWYAVINIWKPNKWWQRIVWYFVVSLKDIHQFLTIELTNLAVCSRKSKRTITFIGCNSIMTNSSIVTRIFFTIVDISKYRNALEFIVIFAISLMICHTDIIYLKTNLLPCYSI